MPTTSAPMPGSGFFGYLGGCAEPANIPQPPADSLLGRFRSLIEVAHAAIARADRIFGAVNHGPVPHDTESEGKPCLAGLVDICDALQFAIYGLQERLEAIESKLGE